MCMLFISGCNKKGAEGVEMESNTIASTLYNAFKDEISNNSNLEDVAAVLSENSVFDGIAMVQMPVEPGFLNGFDGEISGFSKGVMFAPGIGTMPFVGYIFEADDAKALSENLKAHAMLNWNICTVADEMVCEPVGNYVFFAMAPNSFDY